VPDPNAPEHRQPELLVSLASGRAASCRQETIGRQLNNVSTRDATNQPPVPSQQGTATGWFPSLRGRGAAARADAAHGATT
jgi:hypothetical protein